MPSDSNGAERTSASAGPETVEQALALARDHGRSALAEALRALECLLDALALSRGRSKSGEPRGLARVGALLEAAAETLEQDAGQRARNLLQAVMEALDAEIARWERLGRDDAEARAVLRAFLGLREILWEIGVRPDAARPRRETSRKSRGGRSSGPPRVERVPVEG